MISRFLAKIAIERLRAKIKKELSFRHHEAIRMDLEFQKRQYHIDRVHEDAELKLRRAREDWALESNAHQDYLDTLTEILETKEDQLREAKLFSISSKESPSNGEKNAGS